MNFENILLEHYMQLEDDNIEIRDKIIDEISQYLKLPSNACVTIQRDNSKTLELGISNSTGSRLSFGELTEIVDMLNMAYDIEFKGYIKEIDNAYNAFYNGRNIILRGHAINRANTNSNTEYQEKLQALFIANKIISNDEIPENSDTLMNHPSIMFNLNQNIDLYNTYKDLALKTSQALYNNSKLNSMHINNISYQGEKNTIAGDIANAFKIFKSAGQNINTWNPGDICISSISYDEYKNYVNDYLTNNYISKIDVSTYNTILLNLLKENKLYCVSLKLNATKNRKSTVEYINTIKRSLKGTKVNINNVSSTDKSIIISLSINNVPYNYVFRTYGRSVSYEANNDNTIESDIDVRERNDTASLGKAKSIMEKFLHIDPKKGSKTLTDLDHPTYKLLNFISNKEKLSNCKNPEVIKTFNNWINGMVKYLDTHKSVTEAEILTYTRYAAAKENISRFNQFAPYIKIS